MMIKLIAVIWGIVCFAGSAVCATQESATTEVRKGDPKMQMLERKFTELKAKAGTEWLLASKKGSDDTVQIVQSKENGMISYTVTISYHFKSAPTNVLDKAGISVPAGWSIDSLAANEAGEDGQLTYTIPSSKAYNITEFVMSVFRKLFKVEPDTFVFSDETK